MSPAANRAGIGKSCPGAVSAGTAVAGSARARLLRQQTEQAVEGGRHFSAGEEQRKLVVDENIGTNSQNDQQEQRGRQAAQDGRSTPRPAFLLGCRRLLPLRFRLFRKPGSGGRLLLRLIVYTC